MSQLINSDWGFQNRLISFIQWDPKQSTGVTKLKPQLLLPGGLRHASKVGAENQVDIFGEPQKQLDFTIFIQ